MKVKSTKKITSKTKNINQLELTFRENIKYKNYHKSKKDYHKAQKKASKKDKNNNKHNKKNKQKNK